MSDSTNLPTTQPFDISLIGADTQSALNFISNLLQSSTEYSIVGKDVDDNILLWNEGAKRLYGYTPEEAIGKLKVSALHAPEDIIIKKPEEMMRIAIKTGKWEGTLTRLKKNGERVITHTTETPHYNSTGKLIGFLLISKDLTQELRLIEQSKEKEFYTRSLIESSVDPLMTTDSLGNITDVNQQMEKITGINRDKLIGNAFKNYVTDPERAEEGIRRTLKEKKLINYELTVKAHDGKKTIVSYNATVFYDIKGKLQGVFAAARDITAQKEIEEKLKEAVANLARSNKELEQFAYIASHDLQQPLRMIESYTQLLARRYKDKLDQDANDFIDFIVDGVKRMQSLVNNLLEYSRITTRGKPLVPTDCNQILKQVLGDFQEKIKEKSAEITSDTLPTINADNIQIAQLFQNLISNAIKFCERKPKIHISVKEEKTQWVFSVSDNGIGISTEHFPRVFVIFQRFVTEEQYPGNGMGLAICKKIVGRHSGKIWLESTVGKGTTFYFSLPK